MESQNSPHKVGFIYVRHIRACGMCTIKSRRYLLDRGWSNEEIQDFFTNGMLIQDFESHFGDDAMVRQIIEKAKADG